VRVKYEDKIYEFSPDKQRKTTPLDLLARKLPLPRSLKVWLATKSTILKGIKVTEVTHDNGREDLGGN
jgi:hypothetical protein